MFGYMTAQQAFNNGFTHHGKYYGIPLWLSVNEEADEITVAAKWAPLELIIWLGHFIEGFVRSTMYPDLEPIFVFQIGDEISQ